MADDPLVRILPRLENVKKNGAGHTARCPAHDDQHNSLSIGTGAGGRALLKCHAGCKTERVVAAIDLTMADLFPPRAETIRGNGAGRQTAGEGGIPPPHNAATAQHTGLTLAAYADAKRLDPE